MPVEAVASGVATSRFEALGSRCELVVLPASAARLDDGRAWVERMHDRFTRFDEGSELSALNRAAGRGWTRVSPDMEAMLRASLEAWELTGGLVNVAAGAAVSAAGYDRPFASGLGGRPAAPPVRVPPLPEVLDLRRGEAVLAPGAVIDLGGIAKGWMADQLAERLGGDAVANLGGDLVARGAGPAGDGWPVDFAGTVVMLRDSAAATSSRARRRWTSAAGHPMHHLIDPASGAPSTTDVLEVSVIARSGVEAEAFAKAALLLGSAAGAGFLRGRALGWSIR